MERCDANTRSGGKCGKPAGWGTSHNGIGCCKLHGGSTPGQEKHAAMQFGRIMGEELDVEPHEALLQCVRIAAGEVAYASSKVAELEEPLISTMFGPKPDVWIMIRQQATDRLAHYAKLALAAGVAERQVQLAERYGDLIAQVLRGVMDELKLTPAQEKRAPGIVRKQLALVTPAA